MTLSRDIEAMIAACNAADDAQQKFADAHVVNDADPTSEALYEATYELVHRVKNLVTALDSQSVIVEAEK